MKNDSDQQDDDLRSAFRQLRADDAHRAREFEASVKPRRSWRVRQGVVATGLACAAALVSLLVFLNPRPKAAPIANTPVVEEIAFEELSELIDRKLALATVSEWRSPTSFLLNPNLPSSLCYAVASPTTDY